MPPVSDPQVLAIALASGFFLIGGVVTLQSLAEIMRGYASRHWPQTMATVVESRVEEQVNADGQFVFLPLVRYRYTVEGQEYESLNIRFPTKPFVSHRRAQAVVTQHPAAASLRVSYCASQPTTSVVEPGPTKNAFIDARLGISFLLSSGVSCYYLLFVHQP